MNALQQFLQSASNEAAGTISGPVDLIGMGLRKLGVPVPRNALMSSDWMKQNGLMQDVPQNAASLAGQTFGLLSPVVAAAKAPQIAGGLLRVGENVAAPSVVNRGAAKGQRGVFMGDLSKTWDKAAAAKAEAMEKAGTDARTIWQETGTFKGVDGKWRQEIDDSTSSFLASKKATDYIAGASTAEYPIGPISNSLDHKGLSESYPDVMEIRARLKKGMSGAYFPQTGFGEGFNIPSLDSRSMALHEIQHAIQQRQGFASGGGYEDEMYKALAGEAEARAVQKRMNLTAEQRRALFPFDSFDVPPAKQIVR